QLSESAYGLNQLRYDLRKLKGHGLLQRDGARYAYRLTPKASRWRCSSCSSTNASAGRSPTAAFTIAPMPVTSQSASKLETAYHRADKAIQKIVELLAA
ncbi:MAG: hypothetical protein JO139_03265, partial [Alphaproteobacteria bacterium]|nr:hypothetical protein [Alphaproteobacteria bacterium]